MTDASATPTERHVQTVQIPPLLTSSIHSKTDYNKVKASVPISSPTSVASAPQPAIPNNISEVCKNLSTVTSTKNQPVNSNNTNINSLFYVGIIMERPSNLDAPFSWGFSMIKERSHLHIVGLNHNKNQGPTMSFCAISNRPPDPSVVYNLSGRGDYHSHFLQWYPPSSMDVSLNETSFLSPRLQLGDAVLSINGVSISSFSTTAAIADFIRNRCGSRLILVALRHFTVWKAGEEASHRELFPATNPMKNGAETTKYQMLLQSKAKEKRDVISRAIKEGWAKIQKLNYSQSRPTKRKIHHVPTKNGRKGFDPWMFDRMYALADKRLLMNPAFGDEKNPVFYSDNDEFDPDDGRRLRFFASREITASFRDWLKVRKEAWRARRQNIYPKIGDIEQNDEASSTVTHEFWLSNGHQSFDTWLSYSKSTWRRSYSWHKNKKRKLRSETEKEVHFPSVTMICDVSIDAAMYQFNDWLGARKQQWRIARRKRQLERVDMSGDDSGGAQEASPRKSSVSLERSYSRLSSTNDTIIIDELLEDQQRREREREIDHAPLDISWIFDSDLGAPDDVIVLLMRFLNPSDHGNLLCLSWTSNFSLKKRDAVWQSLCPKRWILPRRPRKSWCVMYISKIRAEEETSRKQSDDLLTKADAIIDKGDIVIKFQKLVLKGEKDFAFDVNYTSGTVLERNSLLNISVINRRKNIVKWLVEEKHCDIETCDRGNFTPLLNAAWNGDKYLVRYLLGKGADRKKIGTYHSSKGVASKDFEGMNAEGWARERGHTDVANLIRIGL